MLNDQQALIKLRRIKRSEYAYLRELSEIDLVDISQVDEIIDRIAADRVSLARAIFEQVESEMPTSSVAMRKIISMCYYCQYHMSRALVLHMHRYDLDSHKMLPVELEKILGRRYKDILLEAREKRRKADYEPHLEFDLEVAVREIKRLTREFLDGCLNYLRKRGVIR